MTVKMMPVSHMLLAEKVEKEVVCKDFYLPL